jgi:plasmid maintenance system killer protein
MNIMFRTAQLRKAMNDSRELKRRYGSRAAKIRQRLDELAAASTLEEMRRLPAARCHELKGDRAGSLAVDLGHPFRLVFRPAHPAFTAEGGLDWRQITAIVVEDVVDYH